MDHPDPKVPDVDVALKDFTYSVKVPKHDYEVPNIAKSAFQCATCCKPRKGVELEVLKGVNFIMAPGSTTLVLAPPGSGKTTLMKSIAGLLPQKNVKSGSVKYNGCGAKEAPFSVPQVVGYVPEYDLHMAQLTVRETLEFARRAVEEDPAEHNLPTHTTGQNKTQQMLKYLGLEECADTVVGNRLLRGVSGGQRKRVTIGEILMSQARTLLLDEYSNGLDSATALDITVTLRRWARRTRGSVLAAMLQPTPEVYELFDNVLLLKEGRVIYFGPRPAVPVYLKKQFGIKVPSTRDYADFVFEFLIDPVRISKTYGGSVDASKLTTEGLAEVYKNSQWAKDVVQYIDGDHTAVSNWETVVNKARHHGRVDMMTAEKKTQPEATSTDSAGEGPNSGPGHEQQTKNAKTASGSDDSADYVPDSSSVVILPETEKKEGPNIRHLSSAWTQAQYGKQFSGTFWSQLRLTVARQTKLVFRDKRLVGSHFGQAFFMGWILGSVFWQLSVSEYVLRLSVLVFAAMYLGFASLSEVPTTLVNKTIAARQIRSGMYSSLSYVLSVFIVGIPITVIESTIFGTVAYFTVGLAGGAEEYFTFLGLLICVNFCLANFFRMIAYTARSVEIAQSMSSPFIILFVLFSGFMITKENIEGYYIWAYWLSPFSWLVRSLALNEFKSEEYDVMTPEGRLGDVYLGVYDIDTDDYWQWLGAIVLLAYAVIFLFAGAFFLSRVDPDPRGTARTDEDHGVALAIEDKSDVRGALPFTPITLAFQNVKYAVDVKEDKKKVRKPLLRGINGFAKPGTLTALMGSSGAGKTTLLDVLGGRKTAGYIEGDIKINGEDALKGQFSRLMGYVEQDDIHNAFTTVREALEFSAKLRLPKSVSKDLRSKFVDEVIDLLELRSVQNRLIGEGGANSISRGELKLLTIGVELVTNPSLLFLDEPTSGLDSKSALTVMRVVRNISRTGRTVVCTIHQPSAELFFMFDRLLLLKRGGEEVYFGPVGYEGADLVRYLESVPNVNKKPARLNPASWMLDVIGAGTGSRDDPGAHKALEVVRSEEESEAKETPVAVDAEGSSGEIREALAKYLDTANRVGTAKEEDFPPFYHASALCAENVRETKASLEPPADEALSGKVLQKAATAETPSLRQQVNAVVGRSFLAYWRNVDYNFVRLLIALVLSVLCGLLYLDLNPQEAKNQATVLNILAIIFMGVSFCAVLQYATSMPAQIKDRAAYYREITSKAYSPIAYSAAIGIVEIPYIAGIATVFGTILYWLVNLRHDSAGPFFFYLLVIFLICLVMNFYGQFMASVMPSFEVAQLVGSLFLSMFFLFGGFWMPVASMPEGWKWFTYVNPFRYVLQALLPPQFYCETDCQEIPVVDGTSTVMESKYEYLSDWLGFEYDDRWFGVLALAIFVVVFRIGTMLGFQYVRHLKR